MRRILTERSYLLAAAVFAGALSATPPLHAQPDDDRARARTHFDRGVTLAKQQQYREALSEFQSAYDAFPNHGVLYNIARAQILLDRPSAALITLERYVTDGGAQVPPSRRREVDATIARLRDQTATLTISIEPAGALVTIDDEPVGRSPLPSPVRVDAGRHRVEAALESGLVRELTVEVVARQALSAYLDLRPPPNPSSTPLPPPIAEKAVAPLAATPPVALPPATPRTIAAPDSSTQRTLGYAIGAVGLALSGVAVGHYLWNRGRYEDWQSRSSAYQRDPTEQNRESANQLGRSIPAASAVTVALAIGAGVALGTGTVLVITSAPHPGSATASTGALLSIRGEL